MTVPLDTLERALADIKAGKAVIVVDDENRENEGDIIFAASKATPALMAFLVRHSSGYVCAPMPGSTLDRLGIPLMTAHNREMMRTAYTISVDATAGVTTGISAADRAHTCRVLVDSATEPFELVQPGHVLPLRAVDGGVLEGRSHPARRADARGRDRRGRQRRRHPHATSGTPRVRRRQRPCAHLHRRPPGLPSPARIAGGAGGGDPTAHRVRRVRRSWLSRHDLPSRAHRPGLRQPTGAWRVGPRPFRVPHR